MKTGDMVTHTIKKEWGLGKILKITPDNKVHVFFTDAGMKRLANSPDYLTVEPNATHPLLDRLGDKSSLSLDNYRTFKQMTDAFLKIFPGGFNDHDYFTHERDYKVHAHEMLLEILSNEEMSRLLDQKDYQEIVAQSLKIVNQTNLIFPNEKMSLRDGLKNNNVQQSFALALFEMLYGETELKERFQKFARVLKNLKADKWTIQTYFLFLSDPQQFLFLKPIVTQQAAEICGFDLKYQSQLNWDTYQALLELGAYLKQELSSYGGNLMPRDMIDVQSFIFCVAQKEYAK
jgi:hypothetical protein